MPEKKKRRVIKRSGAPEDNDESLPKMIVRTPTKASPKTGGNVPFRRVETKRLSFPKETIRKIPTIIKEPTRDEAPIDIVYDKFVHSLEKSGQRSIYVILRGKGTDEEPHVLLGKHKEGILGEEENIERILYKWDAQRIITAMKKDPKWRGQKILFLTR